MEYNGVLIKAEMNIFFLLDYSGMYFLIITSFVPYIEITYIDCELVDCLCCIFTYEIDNMI